TLADVGAAVLATNHPGDVLVVGRDRPGVTHSRQTAQVPGAALERSGVADHPRGDEQRPILDLELVPAADREIADLLECGLVALLDLDDHGGRSVNHGRAPRKHQLKTGPSAS